MEDQLEQINAAWNNLLGTVNGIPEERMEDHDVVEGWSVKDVLAHVSYWEQWLIGGVEAWLNGDAWDAPDVDEINRNVAAERQDWPLDMVMDRLHTTHDQVLDLVRRVPDIPEDWLAGSTWDHYNEHAEHIRRWRERRNI